MFVNREIDLIKYLIDEIEKEIEYNKKYEEAENEANKKAEEAGKYWWSFMSREQFPHIPRKSVIIDNVKIIRRMLLNIKKGEVK